MPLVGVTDAKDTFDRVTQDVGFGTQKSIAFTVASIRQQLKRPNTMMRWTATANNFVDAGTKLMDTTHLRQILQKGEWSIEYTQEYTKQNLKKAKPGDEVSVLPGEPLEAKHGGLLEHARHLGEAPGWHMVDTVGVHVAHGAKSFRSPQPRFSLASFPLRTTLGEFNAGALPSWRVLEENQSLKDLSNLTEVLPSRARRLVSFFHDTKDSKAT